MDATYGNREIPSSARAGKSHSIFSEAFLYRIERLSIGQGTRAFLTSTSDFQTDNSDIVFITLYLFEFSAQSHAFTGNFRNIHM
jgi:hypothetical protein